MDYYRSDDYYKISSFYNTVTKNCQVHQPICGIFQMNTKILDYLMAIPNLFEKLRLPNLLATYQKFNSEYGIEDKFQSVSKFASTSTILKGIITGIDYESDLIEEFDSRCKENRFLIGNCVPIREDIWKKMNFDTDIKKVLAIITPFVGECKCNRTCDNYDFAVNNFRLPIERIDLIEKIIWGTKLNDFFYFIEVKNKLIDCKNKIHAHVDFFSIKNIIKLESFNENRIIQILNYFQTNPDMDLLYVYPNGCINKTKPRHFLPSETINIGVIYKPNTCFACDKYDTKTVIKLDQNTYIITKIDEHVIDFACKKCKKRIGKLLNLECVTEIISMNEKFIQSQSIPTAVTHLTFGKKFNYGSDRIPESTPFNLFGSSYPTKNLYKYRWCVPTLLILSKIYDVASIFSLLPLDVIYAIILSTYWDISNTIVDISNENLPDDKILLYSKYRFSNIY
jgi:hypothetical protein